MDATALLRPNLLADRVVALGGGTALGPPLEALGARAVVLSPTLDEDAPDVPADVEVLLHDLRPAFGAGGHDALRTALDAAWVTIRAVANAAFIPGERGGKVTLIAPPPAAGDPAAAAACAAAENLARTLSIEWARHGVTTVAVMPGSSTTDAQLAALAAYLASPAGDYFSGCRLALDELA